MASISSKENFGGRAERHAGTANAEVCATSATRVHVKRGRSCTPQEARVRPAAFPNTADTPLKIDLKQATVVSC